MTVAFLTLMPMAGAEALLPAPVEHPLSVDLNPTARKLIAESGINPQVFVMAWEAYQCARQHGYGRPGVLGIIDYSLPSYDKRFWVFDLRHSRLLFRTYVAQGMGSGWIQATRFSDVQNSYESSLGMYVTDRQPYVGQWGYALRLYGLDRGFNDNAYTRDIVIHGSPYVGEDVVRHYGRIAVTHGCPAVPAQLTRPIIDTLKDGSLVWAYYPEHAWLQNSSFLHCQAG